MLSYHIAAAFYADRDHNLLGHAIEEAVYAPLYYGYGGPDSQAPFRSPDGQRAEMARSMEREMIERAPNTLLVLLKAAPETIRQRIREHSGTGTQDPFRGVVSEADVDQVLARFGEEFEAALFANKIELDTTKATVDETLSDFVRKLMPLLSDEDRARLQL